ncbi:MAG: flagellar hook-length control protein FliK [Gammaproteobacteria bacterium]|nr:flagellar hook-length control protein FliK [Gammaproteobacteria bacterium]MDH5652153.1 flagellar hook-length control protein FliK [Gammaproteobacteria bacterium]
MDLKNLTGTRIDKGLTDSGVVKPSVASSDHPPATPVPTQPARNLQTLLNTLQLGKVFDVIVAKVEGNMMFLSIPGAPADTPLLQAELATPLPVGTRLTLQLTGESTKPQLKVIASPNSPQDPISRDLRSSLQQQQSLPPLLANLNIVARNPARVAALPQEVLEVGREVVRQLPDSRQISQPQGLKHALQQAGPFLENALLNNTVATGSRPELRQPLLPPGLANPLPGNLSAPAGKPPLPFDNDDGIPVVKEPPPTVAQAMQTVVQAMQRQPVQDVRANLLRLALLLRMFNDQNQSAQKALTEQANQSLLKEAAQPPAKTTPGLSPLADTTTGATKSTTGSALSQPNAVRTANPEYSTAVRSQTPQPQAQAGNASLINLLQQDTAIEELLGQVEGVLARIHVQQLQTVAAEQQHRPTWVIELPVRTEQGIDLFDLRIQREHQNHANDDPKAPWTVTLAFDLDRMGPVRVQVTLYGEDRISANIWAEQRATSILFNHYLDSLKSRLKQVGLEVGQINCRCGKPDQPAAGHEPRLVDEKV